MKLDFRGHQFPPHDDRPVWQRPLEYGWNFTQNADADLKLLLDLYANKNSDKFEGDEELLTWYLAHKTLRRIRWQNRLRILRLARAALYRRLHAFLYPRYRQLLKKLKLVAEKEEQQQTAERAPKED